MKPMLKRVAAFSVVAAVFEVIALLFLQNSPAKWIVVAIVILFFLYLAVLAVRGWVRQSGIELAPVMTGRVVRRRHWRLF